MNELLLGIVIVLIAALFLHVIAWVLRFPFLLTNWLQWFLMSPVLHFMRTSDPNEKWPRSIFLFLSPLGVGYWLVAYVILTPLRLLNAIYFNIFLFWAISFRDGLADLILPGYAHSSRSQYAFKWFTRFPLRLFKLLGRYLLVLFQGLATTGFDLLWPTLTLFHGTTLEHAASEIARSGTWWVGQGNYVGTGIYFSISRKVADHYASSIIRKEIANQVMLRPGGTPAVIVARVTLDPYRPVATLNEDLRRRVGWDGDLISREVKFPWVALEHWRDDKGWYEFCLIQSKQNTFVNTWRVRPICVIEVNTKTPVRVNGGIAVWPGNARGWVLLIGTLLAVFALAALCVFNLDNAVDISNPTPKPLVSTPSYGGVFSSTPNDGTCSLASGNLVHVYKKAHLWAYPRVKTPSGNERPIKTLSKGTGVHIIDGPKQGPILYQGDMLGWWWYVKTEDGRNKGWIWQGAINECKTNR